MASSSLRMDGMDPIVRPHFPFEDLPVELALRIALSAARSQSTYRSLVLTSHSVRNMILFEALPSIPFHLSRADKVPAFLAFLEAHPPSLVANVIQFLWIIPDHLDNVLHICVRIIEKCPNLVSLACHFQVLDDFLVPSSSLSHTKCTSLTLIDARLMLQLVNRGLVFMNNLAHIRLIGTVDFTNYVMLIPIPQLKSIKCFSVPAGEGEGEVANERIYRDFIRSPKLERVVFTTRSRGDVAAALVAKVQQIDRRFSVIYRRRRWTELKQWEESTEDPDKFWNQAAAEKDAFFSPAPVAANQRSTRRRRHKHGRVAQRKEDGIDSKQIDPFTLLQRQIMDYLKTKTQVSSEGGFHVTVDEIVKKLGTDVTKTREAFKLLLNSGHLLTTVDDSHFNIAD